MSMEKKLIAHLYQYGVVPGGMNQDGAMATVDAKALAEYGTDRFGMHMPVHFTGEGDSQMKKYSCVIVYVCLQIFVLSLLRCFFVLTVFKTVLIYMIFCIVGVSLVLIAIYKSWARSVRDCFLIVWSSLQGFMVLNFLSNGTFYLTISDTTIFNICAAFLLYWVIYIVTGHVPWTIIIGNLFLGIWGTANYYLIKFRGMPFQISDFGAAKTAMSVAGNFNYTPSPLVVLQWANLVLWSLLWFYFYKTEQKTKRVNFCTGIGTLLAIIVCFLLPQMKVTDLYHGCILTMSISFHFTHKL